MADLRLSLNAPEPMVDLVFKAVIKSKQTASKPETCCCSARFQPSSKL